MRSIARIDITLVITDRPNGKTTDLVVPAVHEPNHNRLSVYGTEQDSDETIAMSIEISEEQWWAYLKVRAYDWRRSSCLRSRDLSGAAISHCSGLSDLRLQSDLCYHSLDSCHRTRFRLFGQRFQRFRHWNQWSTEALVYCSDSSFSDSVVIFGLKTYQTQSVRHLLLADYRYRYSI